MTDFQLIPGVWYRAVHRKETYLEAVFAWLPRMRRDKNPWVDKRGRRFANLDDWEIEMVEYNPHPPTRTEWEYGYGDNWAVHGPHTRREAENQLDEHFKQHGPTNWKLYKRPVQVSEWQEVTE